MESKSFVRRYNKDHEPNATVRKAQAVFAEQGYRLEDFDESDFEYLAELYQSHNDYVQVPRRCATSTQSEISELQKSPFASDWYRSSNCEIQQYDPGRYVKARSDPPYWIFVFSGEVEEYKPGSATLEDALNLSIPDDPFQKPDESIRRFFERWGPMGFYHVIAPVYFSRLGDGPAYARFPYPFSNLQNGPSLAFPKKMKATELWRQFHLSEIQDKWTETVMLNRNKRFFDNYFEYGFMAQPELWLLQWVWELSKREYFPVLNNYLAEGIREVIDKDECGPYKAIKYRGLRDALYAQIALEMDSNRPWKICANEQCRREFLQTKDLRQKYCSDKCRLRQAERNRKRPAKDKGRAEK